VISRQAPRVPACHSGKSAVRGPVLGTLRSSAADFVIIGKNQIKQFDECVFTRENPHRTRPPRKD
jgi:hypothetical protein